MHSPADEQRHQPPSPMVANWEESWYFDFALADGSLGMAVRLAFRPGENRAWYWAHLVGSGRPLVAVRDHDVDIPRGRNLEVRASGLWADFVCETPMEHWTVGLEAFGVALDDPREAYRGERGDVTALGLDLEWEAVDTGGGGGRPATEPGNEDANSGRYEQACTVHGELLAGNQRIQIDAPGHRYHAWGPLDWWAEQGEPWVWAAGRLDDGTHFSYHGPDVAPPEPDRPFELAAEDQGLLGDFDVPTEGLTLRAVPLAQAPVLVPADDRRASCLARALCRMEAGDGRHGYGWAERLVPRLTGRTGGRP